MFGVLSVLPGRNSRAFLEGQVRSGLGVPHVVECLLLLLLRELLFFYNLYVKAVAGIIAAASNLLTIASATTPLDVGFAYFLIGVCIIALTIGLFIILFRNVSNRITLACA